MVKASHHDFVIFTYWICKSFCRIWCLHNTACSMVILYLLCLSLEFWRFLLMLHFFASIMNKYELSCLVCTLSIVYVEERCWYMGKGQYNVKVNSMNSSIRLLGLNPSSALTIQSRVSYLTLLGLNVIFRKMEVTVQPCMNCYED